MIRHPLIYAHRGVWESPDQQNSFLAFETARLSGFGIETDIRSKDNSLIISHDPIHSKSPLEIKNVNLQDIPMALNVKEDGLIPQYERFFQQYPHPYTFLFDGSIPEMFKFKQRSLPHALRLSEYEEELPWETHFIWVDSFYSDWWIKSQYISKLIEKHFLVFVSPELHGRDKKNAWEFFCKLQSEGIDKFGICTDDPGKLAELFNESN